MSNYSRSEIRGAILRAAERIERDPRMWDFNKIYVPSDCGTPACALGWIGFELGMEVSKSIGRTARALFGSDGAMKFYRDFNMASGQSISIIDGPDVPRALRAYADRYFSATESLGVVGEQRNRLTVNQDEVRPNTQVQVLPTPPKFDGAYLAFKSQLLRVPA